MAKVNRKLTSETDIENKLRKHASSVYGVPSTKLNVMGQRGNSDVLYWFPHGCLLIIEKKKAGETPRKLQWENILRKRKLGYAVEWVDNVEDGKQIMRTFYNSIKSHKDHFEWEPLT